MTAQPSWAEPVLTTAEELLAIPEDGRRYELFEGRLMQMAPTGDRHNRTSARLFMSVAAFVSSRGLGEVFPQEAGFLLSRAGEPDTVLAPDLAFVRAENVPVHPIDGYLRLAPDLVAEILSPSQTLPQLRQKAETWLRFGVREVWVLAPNERLVEVWRAGQSAVLLAEGDTLTGAETLTGFSVPVADLFPA